MNLFGARNQNLEVERRQHRDLLYHVDVVYIDGAARVKAWRQEIIANWMYLSLIKYLTTMQCLANPRLLMAQDLS
jgi:hypothetical protein